MQRNRQETSVSPGVLQSSLPLISQSKK